MKVPLSRNELLILDRHMATLTFQTNEIAHLLEVRLGRTNDMAGSARMICDQVTSLANRIQRQNEVNDAERQATDQCQTAGSAMND